jgi:hypothetical protein
LSLSLKSIRVLGVPGLLVVFLLSAAPSARALSFNLTDGAGLVALQTSNNALYTQVRNGFIEAGNIWSSLLTNNVTVNITIDFEDLGSGILGEAGSSLASSTYNTFRNALDNTNSTSTIDNTVIANLPVGSNPTYTVSNPGVTLNSGRVAGTRANFKALGLLGTSSLEDSAITFSSNSQFTYDFDRSNGIDGGAFDFVGIAAHEIGHALGFVSVVDDIDNGATGTLTPRTMDLFRYSSAGTRNLSANNSGDRYFSVNGGIGDANGGAIDQIFANGVNLGDGDQASHWKDSRGLGIMDPTASPGEFLVITQGDLQVFDAIGWNLASANVPEPGTVCLVLPILGTATVRFRRRKSAAL